MKKIIYGKTKNGAEESCKDLFKNMEILNGILKKTNKKLKVRDKLIIFLKITMLNNEYITYNLGSSE